MGSGSVKVIVLDCSAKNQEYAIPHRLEASAGDIIEFRAVNSDFEVLIPNRDRFFDSDDHVLNYYIEKDGSQQTPKINTSVFEGQVKYYIVYCFESNDFADKILSSPPSIVVVP